MDRKTFVPDGQTPPASQIGATLEVLSSTIEKRRGAGEESYTYRLLTGGLDAPLKKLLEEAGEVALAAKDAEALADSGAEKARCDAAIDHLRYEAGDVVYHLLVVLSRFGVSIDELSAEMNSRMSEDEIALHEGMLRLKPEHINRGK